MASSTTSVMEFGLLEISGADSERLLQGQLTCDVIQLKENQWVYGACCNAKGRMVANFIIARNGDRYILRLPLTMVEVLKQHLSKYAVFYKVSLQELNWQRATQSTDANSSCQWTNDSLVFTFSDGRQENWSPTISASVNTSISAEDWAMADIVSGVAWVTPGSKEAWVPQHIGWNHLDGISFKKGCYTGQEVVARLQYLGKSKRQLVSIRLAAPVEATVMSDMSETTSGKNLGELISHCGIRGLAVIQGYEEGMSLLLNGTSTTQIEPVFQETEQ